MRGTTLRVVVSAPTGAWGAELGAWALWRAAQSGPEKKNRVVERCAGGLKGCAVMCDAMWEADGVRSFCG